MAQDKKHDIAGGFARSYINSPLTPLFLLAFLVMGIIGILITPRQEDPQISVPMVDIFVQYPGASNRQVEALVAEPLERLMHEIKGVKHVYSVSQRGMGMVTVEFDVGEDMEESLVKLYNKLASNMDKIPPGVQQPLVKPKGPDDVPVVTFTLSSKALDQSQLRLMALDVLQELSKVDNVAQGFIVGGEPREVRIDIDPERLAGYGIPLTQIGQVIRAANAELEAGELEAFQRTFKVYTGDFLKTVEDIKNLVVGVHNNKPVYVRDIAHVYEGHSDISNIVLRYTGPAYEGPAPAVDGEPAVTVALAKKPLSNGVTVAEEAIAKLESLKGTLIPEDVTIQVSRDYGKTANEKVNELIFKLFVATGAVTLLVWFFLGWRAATVVVIVIPVVILSTVFAAWLMDFTIDRVSLFALIFSIGILVDDAVVVLENIYRRWLMEGRPSIRTTIDAVSEVGNPTIIATLTVIAALAPMAFVSGMMGPYMAPIPALGSVAMVISLFAAFAFTPWLAQRIRPTMQELEKAEKREHEQNQKIESFFRRLLTSLLIDKMKGWGFLGAIIAGFIIAIALVATKAVPVKLLPYDNKPDFSVIINFPEGTALPVTANLAHELVQALQQNVPEIKTLESYAGTAAPFDFNGLVRHYYLRQNPWEGDIQVHLVDKHERERASHEIAESVRELLTPIARRAGARIQVVEMPPGPPVLQSIVAEVYAPGDELRKQLTQKLTGVFQSVPIIGDVDNFLTDPHDTWRFVIDKQKAMEKGISVEVINQTVSMAMGEYKIGDVKEGFVREPTYITLQVPLEARAEFARLGQIPVSSSQGFTVPLAELGRFVLERQQDAIYHKDLTPVQYVTGTGVGRLGAPIYGMLAVQDAVKHTQDPLLKQLDFNFVFTPDALKETGVLWSGEWTVTYETFRDMGLAFAVALLVIYMLVVWEFKNFLVPLIVMAPIPLTLIGIAPGHWLLDAEFTATSMIGFIALAGIIVRNSILLVDFSRQAIEAGCPVTEAVIAACKTRTRPILITALALVLGSSVILFDPIFQGMAISLMFGTLVSTILTLVVIPLGCVSARKVFCPKQENDDGQWHAQCDVPTQPHSPHGGGAAARLPTPRETRQEEDEAQASPVAPDDVTQAKAGASSDPATSQIPDVIELPGPVVDGELTETPDTSTKAPTHKDETKPKRKPRGRKRGIRLKDLDDE